MLPWIQGKLLDLFTSKFSVELLMYEVPGLDIIIKKSMLGCQPGLLLAGICSKPC